MLCPPHILILDSSICLWELKWTMHSTCSMSFSIFVPCTVGAQLICAPLACQPLILASPFLFLPYLAGVQVALCSSLCLAAQHWNNSPFLSSLTDMDITLGVRTEISRLPSAWGWTGSTGGVGGRGGTCGGGFDKLLWPLHRWTSHWCLHSVCVPTPHDLALWQHHLLSSVSWCLEGWWNL